MEPIAIPEPLRPALAALARKGRPLLVGGCVRDWLLGLPAKDIDIEVFGISVEEVVAALQPFGRLDLVGRSFGVIKLGIEGRQYDISLPRRESKAGQGHRGFSVQPDAQLSPTEAASRRDFTINALLYDPFSHELIDPFRGAEDLRNGVLRHTSNAFAEDPLRPLRAFQFAGRFNLQLDAGTASLCRSMLPEASSLPLERVWGEWRKWAAQSSVPSRGLDALRESGWIELYPELARLVGLPQEPEWHPEGDVFTHTKHCLDSLVKLPAWQSLPDENWRARLALAVLAHDFGKAVTTTYSRRRGNLRWTSPGHEGASGPLATAFLERIGPPLGWLAPVRSLVEAHGFCYAWQGEEPSLPSVRRLAQRLAPATIKDLLVVMEADHRGRPPLISAETETRLGLLRTAAHQLELEETAPRPLLLGRHLIAAGLEPGVHFKPLLDLAFEAQLDGAFSDEAGAKQWLQAHLSPSASG
jgi:tRNA nucleotidyltransferase (CCA-adding enzyme)